MRRGSFWKPWADRLAAGRLSPDGRTFVLNSSLQTGRDVLVNLFVLIFIWKIDQNLATTCQLRLGSAILIPFFALAGGALCHRFDRVRIYRIGILLYLPVFLCLILLGKQSASFAFLIGALLGVAEGIYWSSRQTLDFEYARGKNSAYFIGLQSSLSGIVGMATPVAAGFIIERTPRFALLGERSGYAMVFGLAILIAVVGLLLTLNLPADRHRDRLRHWKAFVPHSTNPAWSLILVYHVFSGFKFTILIIFSAVVSFHVMKSEIAVGGIYTLGALVSIVTAYFLGHLVNRSNRMVLYSIGVALFVVSTSLLFFRLSVLAISLFILLQRLSESFFRIPVSTVRYDAIRTDPAHREAKIEYSIAFEPYIAIGRIAALLVMMIFLSRLRLAGIDQFSIVPQCAIFLCVLPVLEFTLIAIANRSIVRSGVRHADMTR